MLEEVNDERLLAAAKSAPSLARALASLRSQRGWESAWLAGCLDNHEAVVSAWALTTHPVSQAMLAPLVGDRPMPAPPGPPIARIVDGPLRAVTPGSARHRALVEAVRRLYVQQRMSEDRADKERARSPT